ncbi:hypothetical protein ACGFYV_26120 [Streptomyces sp. NPDC048297]|uniref:hypothetical protein n=1 Tax=Streptomyces sp. NPDC048297 TaxID=3365531 RepID=UPI00371FE914
MQSLQTRLSRVADALRWRIRLIRSARGDAGGALEWALVLVGGATLVGLVYTAANTKITEKAAQILGF